MIYLSKHPLVADKIARLRDKNTPPIEFRRLVKEISMCLGYEALAGAKLQKCRVATPLAPCACKKLSREITFVAVLRAGLSMIEGLADIEPKCRMAHIGIYRNEKTLKPVRYYAKFPSGAARHFVVLADPMLATGGSAAESINMLKLRGIKNIVFVCIIASEQGIKKLRREHPDVPIYAGAMDKKLNNKGYIVPGLGDAGDRMFGTD